MARRCIGDQSRSPKLDFVAVCDDAIWNDRLVGQIIAISVFPSVRVVVLPTLLHEFTVELTDYDGCASLRLNSAKAPQ